MFPQIDSKWFGKFSQFTNSRKRTSNEEEKTSWNVKLFPSFNRKILFCISICFPRRISFKKTWKKTQQKLLIELAFARHVSCLLFKATNCLWLAWIFAPFITNSIMLVYILFCYLAEWFVGIHKNWIISCCRQSQWSL